MSTKKIFCTAIISGMTLYAITILLYYLSPPRYGLCEIYTEKMNGGTHKFKGREYKIILCGLDGSFESGIRDEVRLQVFSEGNELLAERYFEPL